MPGSDGGILSSFRCVYWGIFKQINIALLYRYRSIVIRAMNLTHKIEEWNWQLMIGWLLVIYVLPTSKVISGQGD